MQVMTVDITTHQPPLAELLKLLDESDEIVLAAAGHQVARLVPAATPPKRIAGLQQGQGWVSEDFDDPLLDNASLSPRVMGLHEGQGWMSDDFDDPLPDEFWSGRM